MVKEDVGTAMPATIQIFFATGTVAPTIRATAAVPLHAGEVVQEQNQ